MCLHTRLQNKYQNRSMFLNNGTESPLKGPFSKRGEILRQDITHDFITFLQSPLRHLFMSPPYSLLPDVFTGSKRKGKERRKVRKKEWKSERERKAPSYLQHFHELFALFMPFHNNQTAPQYQLLYIRQKEGTNEPKVRALPFLSRKQNKNHRNRKKFEDNTLLVHVLYTVPQQDSIKE